MFAVGGVADQVQGEGDTSSSAVYCQGHYSLFCARAKMAEVGHPLPPYFVLLFIAVLMMSVLRITRAHTRAHTHTHSHSGFYLLAHFS